MSNEVKIEDVLNKPYIRRLEPDPSGGYVVTVSEFPGCIADGNSADEAIANFETAAEAWVEGALHQGFGIREPLNFDGASGKLALRIPRSLHRDVAEMADLEGVSINQLIASSIAMYVGQKRGYFFVNETLDRLVSATHELRAMANDSQPAIVANYNFSTDFSKHIEQTFAIAIATSASSASAPQMLRLPQRSLGI
ncbi:MAG TPA: type II toxin-antitoxin system HicB family antitoxin [Methylophilaceae bacterium]|jgi:predicted RNase H-like HicB family nuclease